MSSIWDEPEMRSGTDYVAFVNEGDSVAGVVTGMTMHTFDDGKRVPKLFIDTEDGERILTAGQVQLKSKLAELRPEVGDKLAVVLVKIEKRAGNKTLKHFDVQLKRAAAGASELI